MATRPLDRLTSIRAKLGSTVVIAVGLALLISYLLIAFALRNSPRDSEAIDALSLARRAATGGLRPVPAGTMVVILHPDGSTETRGADLGELPRLRVEAPRWGVLGANVFATVPTADGGSVTALTRSPSRGFLGRLSATTGFLQSVWWQFLLVGVVAASVSLVVARLMARGMTQPLRDMAAAARRMETGDYSVRVHTTESGRGRQARHGLRSDARRARAPGAEPPRPRRQRVPRAQDADHRDPCAPREPPRRRGAARPGDARRDAVAGRAAGTARRSAAGALAAGVRRGPAPDRGAAAAAARRRPDLRDRRRAARGAASRCATMFRSISPSLSADRERVHQVLFNLVDNAVRFTPDGGSVTVSARRRNGSVEVARLGHGRRHPARAPPAALRALLPRRPGPRDAGKGGTGIGLAIARSVVEAHGGQIKAESRPGQGSIFTFDLPAADRERPLKTVITSLTRHAAGAIRLPRPHRRPPPCGQGRGHHGGSRRRVLRAHHLRPADQRVGGRRARRLPPPPAPSWCPTRARTTGTTTSSSGRRTCIPTSARTVTRT